MTIKKIFKDIWSIENAEIRAERINKLAEQDEELATKIKMLLRYSDRFQSVLDDPLIFLDAPSEEQQAARYSVTSELAKGGMGVIYAAYDSQMRRDVVLKCLQLKHRNNFQAVQRFYSEAHITGQLQHPGIAPVYELGELEDGRPFYCMKLVEGKTLAQFLIDRGSPEADKTSPLNFFLQICQTMAFAHERGMIHRDLKPSNIMVEKHGQTKIMDWGVAKSVAENGVSAGPVDIDLKQLSRAVGTHQFESGFAETDQPDLTLTLHGQIIGTPGYMSPEQASGKNDLVSRQSDVYSLGAILFEILTGTTPAKTEALSAEKLGSALKQRDQLLLDSNADLEMADLARSCLQQEPAVRPADAGVVAQTMLTYFASRETAARAAQIRLEKELTRNEEARKRRFSFTVCLVACLGILVAGIAGTSIGFYKESEARAFADANAEDARVAEDLAVSAKMAADDSKVKAEARLAQLTKVNEILGSVFENLHANRSVRSGDPLVDLFVENLDQAAAQLEGDAIGAPDVIASFQTKIGKCYHAFGKTEKAIPLFEKVDRFSMAEYGIENEIARNARCQLADSLSSNNQAKRANLLYQDLQDFLVRSGKTESREFLRIQYKLSSNYLVMNEKQKALELIETHSEQGLEIIGAEYGLHMAQIYNFNRMPEKAVEALKFALAEMIPNDPQKESAQTLLSRAYLRLNQPRKALPILEKLSRDFDKRYGNLSNVKSNLVSLSMAKALQRVGRYRDSIIHLKKFLRQTETIPQHLHKQRTFALYWIVEAYLKTGDYPKALQVASEIHKNQIARYGTGHWISSLSVEKLADIYLLVNQPDKAEEYLDISFMRNHEHPRKLQIQQLGREKFKRAVLSAYREGLESVSDELKKANQLLDQVNDEEFNVYPIYFDNLEPKIWLAESLVLQGDKASIQTIEEFEAKIMNRSKSLDEQIVLAQYLRRACVARYVVEPDEILIARLKELIEILKQERLEGAQTHMLEEARSLLGMAYLKLGKTAEAKRQLESSFASLQVIDNPSPQTSQATIDAGKRLEHFYLLTNANEDADRVSDTIKTIKSNTDRIPSFTRSLIDKTLTTE